MEERNAKVYSDEQLASELKNKRAAGGGAKSTEHSRSYSGGGRADDYFDFCGDFRGNTLSDWSTGDEQS